MKLAVERAQAPAIEMVDVRVRDQRGVDSTGPASAPRQQWIEDDARSAPGPRPRCACPSQVTDGGVNPSFAVAGAVTLLYSTRATVLRLLVIGIAAGALTGVPIGPVNVAVIDAAYRHTLRRAIAVGLGGALGDGLYSGLAVFGVTPLLSKFPGAEPMMYGASGLILLIYGALTVRSPPASTPIPADEHLASDSIVARREMWSGFRVGLALIVLNPAAIVTWVVIVGSRIHVETHLQGVACTLGVMLGSCGWFTLVAYLTRKGKNVFGEKAAWIPRIVGIGLIFYAVYLIAQAIRYVV